MRSPWGSWYYNSGAWSNTTTDFTISNISGLTGQIEIVAIAHTGSPTSITSSGSGGSFTYIRSASYLVGTVLIYARLLTDSNSHSVTVNGLIGGSTNYRRVSVYTVANPMNVGVSDLAGMSVSKNYNDGGGSGTTTYFPDCSNLKISGGSRLDIGVAFREYNIDSGYQTGLSLPYMSFDAANANGLSGTPYYEWTNANGVSWDAGSPTWRSVEDIGRRNYSFASGNNWADGGFGVIPYYNKCPNYRSPVTYPQLSSFIGAVSFVIPNYGGTQMVL